LRKILCCLCLSCTLSATVAAQTIKLGSLAPEGSPWDRALRRIAADWNAASDGRLRVKVFAGGIALVAWFLAGWAYLFSKTPVDTLREAQRLKLQADPSSPEIVDAWKELKFHVVPVAPTEVLTALQSDMLEAFLLTPLTAAAMQWFGMAKNMMDLPLAPMLSGIVVSERVWEGIPGALQAELLAIVQRHLETLTEETAALEQEAVQIMLENGLQIHPVSPQAAAEWQRVIDEGLDLVTGTVVSEQMFAEVQMLLDQYRRR
jgi:TRAP-type C4-dicarboxylate transport system substrate-binding protein